MKQTLALLFLFSLFLRAPFCFSQPLPDATPQTTATPSPESLIPAGSKILKTQWGNFRGTRGRDLLILYRDADHSGTHAAVFTLRKYRLPLLWEQAFDGQGDFEGCSGFYPMEPSSKIPFLVAAPRDGKGGKAFLFKWNGKTFEAIPGTGIAFQSLDIQDLKNDKRLELISTVPQDRDVLFGLKNGALADVSLDFPEYYERPEGRYYPSKPVLLGDRLINRLDIYLSGCDPSGAVMRIKKPAARLWLSDPATNKDVSYNIPDFSMSGTRFTANLSDPSLGTLAIRGRFLDRKFLFKTRPSAHAMVLNGEIRFTGPDNKKSNLTDIGFAY